MNWQKFAEFAPRFVDAAGITLFISWWGIFFALVAGLAIAVVRLFRVPVLTQVLGAYIEFSRNTPSLVQLFFLYFGLPKIGLVWSQRTCAIVCLAFLGASYMAEAFRAALESVPKIQHESAQVLGLSRLQAMRYIVLPQAMAAALPGVVANVIFLIKESSIVSGIALADLMYVAKEIIGQSYDTFEALGLLVCSYIVILVPISIAGTLLERRFSRGRA